MTDAAESRALALYAAQGNDPDAHGGRPLRFELGRVLGREVRSLETVTADEWAVYAGWLEEREASGASSSVG